MRITNDIRTAHRKLSNASLRFLEFLEKNPGALLRASFNALEGKDDVGKLQSWPTFINQQTSKQMEEACVNVFNLIKRIPTRIFANDPDKMSHYYEIPRDIVKIQWDGVNDQHIDNLLARGDFIFSPSGLKCLEYNVSGGVGGMQVAYWVPMYANIPIISKFLQEYQIKICNNNLLSILIHHVSNTTADKFPTDETEINIALVIPKYIEGFKLKENRYLNQIYKNILLQFDRKGTFIFCDYPHLHAVDGYLFYKNKKIHALIEMYHGVLPNEILHVFKIGNICLYNGPITKLLSNKLNLALLSQHEDSDTFSLEEREMIKKYIPWTRRVIPGEVTYKTEKVKLEAFIFSNRERLVLKPSLGFSGSGIYIGKNTPGTVWEKVVTNAFRDKSWLIQEYIESLSYLYQQGEEGCAAHKAAWGFFVFGSQYAGVWVRVLPSNNKSGVINSIQGAEETVAIEVAE